MTFEEMLNSHATLSVESNAMHTKVNLTGDACKLVWMATRAIGSAFEDLPDAQVVEALAIAAKKAIDREAADRMIQLNASGKEKKDDSYTMSGVAITVPEGEAKTFLNCIIGGLFKKDWQRRSTERENHDNDRS